MNKTWSPWISTMSGARFDFLEPDPASIHIGDIAAALAATARWNGHTISCGEPRHYSVAQHSVHCAEHCCEFALAALLHDAAEAYVGDVCRPLKDLLGEVYRDVETRVQQAIFLKFGLPPEIPAEVKAVDDRLLMTEKRDLQPLCPPWDWEGPEPFDFQIVPWSPSTARRRFTQLFRALTSNSPIKNR